MAHEHACMDIRTCIQTPKPDVLKHVVLGDEATPREAFLRADIEASGVLTDIN